MEILFRGTPKPEKIYHGICLKCKSEIKATHKEISHIECWHRDLHSGTCPVCHGSMSFTLQG